MHTDFHEGALGEAQWHSPEKRRLIRQEKDAFPRRWRRGVRTCGER